jgi:hypothetical protein
MTVVEFVVAHWEWAVLGFLCGSVFYDWTRA